jgi:hypothetical protein
VISWSDNAVGLLTSATHLLDNFFPLHLFATIISRVLADRTWLAYPSQGQLCGILSATCFRPSRVCVACCGGEEGDVRGDVMPLLAVARATDLPAN